MYVTFQSPYYLYFLLVVPLIIFIYLFSTRKKGGKAIRFANIEAIKKIRGVSLVSRNIMMFILNIILAIAIIFALSGMVLHMDLDASSHSYVLAIDSSTSMVAEDILPNRLEAAKKTALDFVDASPVGTRMGLISFSGTSEIKSPVTQDKNSIKYALRNIEPRDIGGTNLFDAVTTSTNLLTGELAKAVILISDGQNNVRSVEGIIDYANSNDVTIHSFAVGTEKGIVADNFNSSVNEDILKAIAHNTRGNFYHIQSENDLEDSFANVLQITRSKVPIPLKSHLLIFSIILILINWILYNTRFRIIP